MHRYSMLMLMMVLAGLPACQQQEKAEPAGSSQMMEEQAPAKSAGASATMKNEVKSQTGSAGMMTATRSAAAGAGDPKKGAKIAKGKCGACHFFDKDKKKVGPTMKGIFNRAPAIEGVPFARWDEAALDAWLISPKAVKPKTKMAFKGMEKKDQRDDLIAYLKTL